LHGNRSDHTLEIFDIRLFASVGDASEVVDADVCSFHSAIDSV
jgi:hypothetical protein